METTACCSADRRTIELLLGAPVEQVMTVAEGGHQCEYLVLKADRPEGAAARADAGDENETNPSVAVAGGLLPVLAQKGTASQR